MENEMSWQINVNLTVVNMKVIAGRFLLHGMGCGKNKEWVPSSSVEVEFDVDLRTQFFHLINHKF